MTPTKIFLEIPDTPKKQTKSCPNCAGYSGTKRVADTTHIYNQWGRTVTWWRHQMETLSALLVLCDGNPPVTSWFPSHKGQWRGAWIFSSICAWTNVFAKNQDPADLRRHRTHYDVRVMILTKLNATRGWRLFTARKSKSSKATKRMVFNACHVAVAAWLWEYQSDGIWAPWCLKFYAIRLFVQQLVRTSNKENNGAVYHLPFVWEIHPSPVDSTQKGPIMRKCFQSMK